MLNDARVASLGFFKDDVYTTRINKEKNFKIKFQVLLKFAQIPPDYIQKINLKNPILNALGRKFDLDVKGRNPVPPGRGVASI